MHFIPLLALYGRLLVIFQFSASCSYLSAEETSNNFSYEFETRINVLYQDWQSESFIQPGQPFIIAQNDSDITLRRLRPALKLSWGDSWQGKLAYELGDAGRSIKDLYLKYSGVKWLDIKLGNDTIPFSRERMISSASQHAITRSLSGDTEFGVPGRQLGLHLETDFDQPFVVYYAIARANIHGDLLTEIQFISPIEDTDIADSLVDEGKLQAVRIDYHLMGKTKYREDNFNFKPGVTLSLAGYQWTNAHTRVELDKASGLEIAAAFRGFGWSLELQRNRIKADSPFQLQRPLFIDGVAKLNQTHIELGYLLLAEELQLFVGYQTMQADAWTQDWAVKEIGANYFFSKHDHKLQLSFRDNENIKGKLNERQELFLQWQYRY